ncbi:MAG: hypothetical protein IK088_02485, partial [Lachnospiraceae bacterium]|nr:hypothetical protein [Lachnospiraceae bacterium]
MSEPLKVGMVEVSITPDKSISLVGQFYERISEYVETPITMTAFAAVKDGEQMTIVSCDLTGLSDLFVDDVRSLCKDIKGFEPEKLIMNATHTHTSHTFIQGDRNTKNMSSGLKVLSRYMKPGTYESAVGEKKPEMSAEESYAFLVEHGAEVVHKAWADLHEGHVVFGFGRAAVGMCRRAVYDDGSAKMWGDTNLANFTALEGGNDSGIEIGFVETPEGKLEGIIANVSCPSQVTENYIRFSADYWNEVREGIAKEFGKDVFVLPQCAAAGDLSPRVLHYKQAQARRFALKYGLTTEYTYPKIGNKNDAHDPAYLNAAMMTRRDIAERI